MNQENGNLARQKSFLRENTVRNQEKVLRVGDTWLNIDTVANLPLNLYTFKMVYCENFQAHRERGE